MSHDARPPPELSEVESGLKDFQRATVDYVFRRLYDDPDYTRRFLVADEVGLGKTLVARGVVARAIRHLWDDIERIDVVYICSNRDIARQNINRLNVMGERDFDLASRLTLLPIELSGLRSRKLNFVALTPGTSFNLRSSLGTKKERALLYWLLKEPWGLEGAAPYNVLQGYVQDWRAFRRYVRQFPERHSIDQDLARAFAQRLKEEERQAQIDGRESLRARFQEVCERFPRARKDPHNAPRADRKLRREIVGRLRGELAEVCIEELEPDLVILDEFQRFKDLLSGESEAGLLAQELFQYSDEVAEVRVLLLSATPYKMYTLSGESGDDHYRDFLDTLSFLFDSRERTRRAAELLKEYRRHLYRMSDDALPELRRLKARIEELLRKVMVRTERLSASRDRSGMLTEVDDPHTDLTPEDVQGYLALQQVTRELGQPDTLAYWKSAPYLLTFMEGYKFKEAFDDAAERGEATDTLYEAIEKGRDLALPWQEIREYGEVATANPRLRAIAREVLENGAWQLLWIPPSMPYHQAQGPFARPELEGFTKRLVFSAWRVVPKAVATLLSYGAERRIVRSWEPDARNTKERRKRHHTPLQFTMSEGRLTGMPVLGMLYPSVVLGRVCDPLELAGTVGRVGDLPDAEDVLRAARSRIEERLAPIVEERAEEGPEDEAWYWAAPLLLDRRDVAGATADWWGRRGLAGAWSGGEDGERGSRFADHVDEARAVVEGRVRLGSPPEDLAEVLALMGVAGPGNAALRALGRVLSEGDGDGRGREAYKDVGLRDAAARVGWAFRSLFNPLEAVALIRGLDEREPYWRRVLEYSLAGNLQSVLDEYVHVLKEGLGHMGPAGLGVVREIADQVSEVLSLRTVSLRTDEVSLEPSTRQVNVHRTRMRAHFAHRFGDESGSEEQAGYRAEQVRWAFNSPFWPFVLATTSVGQEGLDFHTYCHAIVHWNLPSNPVDLEQREGRIHRYKGHALRKNLAWDFGERVLLDGSGSAEDRLGLKRDRGFMDGDPWTALFHHGEETREEGQTELVPFWVYTGRDGDAPARIERHVPTLPLSRDSLRLSALRRSLAVYRMVFGQPRQEDLLEFLLEEFGEEQVQEWLGELRVDLAPSSLPG